MGRGVVAAGACILAASLLVVGACGSFSGEDEGGASDAGTEGSRVDDGGRTDAGARPLGCAGGRDAGFTCGALACNASLDQVCCTAPDGGASCQLSKADCAFAVECLSTNDCPGAMKCCQSNGSPGTECHTGCAAQPTVCASDDECASNEYCAPPEPTKYPWWRCKPCP